MKTVHLECKPDELLAMALGIPRKKIKHHAGKSRVYNALKNSEQSIGIVDEDPDPNPDAPKYSYEKDLVFGEEKFGIKRYFDKKRNNTVIVLKGKLEDWVISGCRDSELDMTKSPYSLPGSGNALHKVLNDRLPAYEKLLDSLLAKKNKSLLTLQDWLEVK